MKILVTSAKSNISKKIIMDLKKNHDVISTDVSGQNNHNFVQCQLDELHDTDLLLKDVDIKVSRLARGVPVGSSFDYIDEVTLTHSLEDRIEYK